MDGDKVSLAAACMRGSYNKERNLQKYMSFIEEAAEKEVKFLSFPECSLQGYIWSTGIPATPEDVEMPKYYYETAETVPGPSTDIIQEAAARHNMYIQIGLAEKVEVGSRAAPVLYNASAIIGPEGVVGKYRKTHNQFEFSIFNPGDSFPVYDTGIGKVGMLICYDTIHPESAASLVLQGAELISISTAWPSYSGHEGDIASETFQLACKANAAVNHVWVMVSNLVGVHEGGKGNIDFTGNGQIIAPNGRIVAETGRKEGLAVAIVDIKEGIVKATSQFFGTNILKDRRPELYGIVSDSVFHQTGKRSSK